MDPVRFGLAIRALRRRHRWTQAELAERSGLSQSAISRAERGEAMSLTVKTLASIAEALGGRASVKIYWKGEALDRLLDAAHAGLVEQVITMLVGRGWQVVPEATFNVYGDRGSVDVLAFHPGRRALLIVEVKSVVPDMQAMLAAMDRKVRLAPQLARARGWRPATISRLLVLPDDRTARRRLVDHEATVSSVLPARTVAARHWMGDPQGVFAGVLFVPDSQRTTGRHRISAVRQTGAAREAYEPGRSSAR